MARRLYSTLIRLKVMPEQWKVEVICPVFKSGSPVCRTDDLRPIKLQEVAKKLTMSTVKGRLQAGERYPLGGHGGYGYV